MWRELACWLACCWWWMGPCCLLFLLSAAALPDGLVNCEMTQCYVKGMKTGFPRPGASVPTVSLLMMLLPQRSDSRGRERL